MSASPSLLKLADDRFTALEVHHPCLSRKGHGKAGRLHLPVSPACNIRCRFCARGLNRTRSLPGNAAGLITPEEAPGLVTKARLLCPELAVVGVAGPGDSLASNHALRALKAVHAEHPDLIMCLSTNGLRLADLIGDVVDAGVATVTVTVNSVDPPALARLNRGVVLRDDDGRPRLLKGEESARVLIGAQLRGITAAVERGVVVKVNAVLVPGVNDTGIGDIARAARQAGASLMNVTPLIPTAAAGDLEAPSCADLQAAREAVEEHLPVFRHCRQCRADALGAVGGEDLAGKLYSESVARAAREVTFSHG